MIGPKIKTAPSKTRAARPTLTIIAIVFFLAGLSRLGLGVADVLAAETELPDDPTALPIPTETLLAALQSREAALLANEQKLADRQSELDAAEAEIRTQLANLKAAEEQLLQTLSRTESAAEDDVVRLVSVYENMKPKQAAELFSQMDVDFAAGFFVRLRPDFAGAIMAELDPVTAYAISAVLAGRHARTPRN